MDEELRQIAQENVQNKKKSQWGLFVALFGVIPFFLVAAKTKEGIWLIFSGLTFVIGFAIYIYYERKIIGKKTATDIELERLKALQLEEKLELPKLDDAEVRLREMVRNNSKDDMV